MALTKLPELPIADPRRSPPAPSNQADHLACLLAVAQVINSSLELDVVLDRLLSQAMSVLHAESGSVMLVDEATNRLTVLAAGGPRADEIFGRSQRVGQGIAGWVALNGTPLLLHGRPQESQYETICDRDDVHDALCVPVVVDTRVLGIISLNNCLLRRSFDEPDLALLEAISSQAALAIRNAQSFEEMRRQQSAVERLLREVVNAQEEERKRIALQIHDGPAQTFHALLRGMETVSELAERDPAACLKEVATLGETVRLAMDEVRNLIVDLRPLSMDDLGLLAGLRRYGKLFEERSGVQTQICHRGLDVRIPEAVETALYRIAQEALNNIWKHANADHARVVIEVDEDQVAVEIGDDGTGFQTDELRDAGPQHLGLASIRDRVELMGGRLAVASVPGEGTVVRVAVPLEQSTKTAGSFGPCWRSI